MREKKTVLMLSHQLSGQTGFANVTRNVAMALDKAGHDADAIGQTYHGTPIHPKELGNVTMLPLGNDQWGADIVPFYMETYKPDIVWTLTDIWACHYLFDYPKKWPWQWVRHITLDTENVIPWWADTIKKTDVPIAFSKMGLHLMRKMGVEWGTYIPHGVNVSAFKPAADGEKEKLRANLKTMDVTNGQMRGPRARPALGPDDFVISCVAHNQFRKNLDVLVRAFARFSHKNPQANAKLVMHCQPKAGLGWDLPMLFQKYGVDGSVFLTSLNAEMLSDVFVSEAKIRDLYAMSDVHCLLTGGEGFGIPIVEAMASGIPNICTSWTTPKEFLVDVSEKDVEKDGKTEHVVNFDMARGIVVPIDHVLDHHTGGEWGVANEEQAAQALEYLWKNPDIRAKMGANASAFAVENYDWAKILPQWVELVENVAYYAKPIKREEPEIRLLDFKP